ncbi:MAG: HAMP domain-containing sensor histidine kinase [Pseudomonadota bacterium]
MKKRRYVWLLLCVIASAIFVLDTIANVDISVSVLYVTLVMVVQRTGTVREILIAGSACFLLTIASYGLMPGFSLEKLDQAGLINVFISLFAIASVTYLSIKVVTSETTVRKARDQVARTMLGVSMNELATSVVHEINQPLGAIGANVAAAKRWLDTTPAEIIEARAAMDAAVRDARRAEDVISGLRRLASPSLSNRETFNLTELIRESVDIFRPEINEYRINLGMHFSQERISIDGDRTLLQQIITNVLSNAIEAMLDDKINDRTLIVTANLVAESVSIVIRDTGTGISQEHVDHIFDPFYTTKPKGLGIGLAISHSIAVAHGGSMRALPNTPHGTVISIMLPKSADKKY